MMKTPLIPISWGELLDKITILEIKSTKIKDQKSLGNITKELALLRDIKRNTPADNQQLTELINCLSEVNQKLWNIEDILRKKEAEGSFDIDFINLARSVYKENDKRASIKKQINEFLKSELTEEKLYTNY